MSIMSLKKPLPKYETYKDSGIEWLGEIPNSWKIVPLKRTLSLISEKVISSKSSLTYIGMENIESWSGNFIPSQTEVGSCFRRVE